MTIKERNDGSRTWGTCRRNREWGIDLRSEEVELDETWWPIEEGGGRASRKLPAFFVDHCAHHQVLHRWLEEQTEGEDEKLSLISLNQ